MNEGAEAHDEPVDEREKDSMKLLSVQWNCHQEEVDPVMNDRVVLLRGDGIREESNEELMLSEVGRLGRDFLFPLRGMGLDRDWFRWRRTAASLSGVGVDDRMEDMQELVLKVKFSTVDTAVQPVQ